MRTQARLSREHSSENMNMMDFSTSHDPSFNDNDLDPMRIQAQQMTHSSITAKIKK